MFSFTKLMQAISSVFSPSSLFASGEQGTWYDPSDWTTLFQNSAGTTPVTAVEQPVGLMLDKSKGLALGPELVTNGDFSNGTTGWTENAVGALSVSGGEATVTNITTGSKYAYQPFTTVVGKVYVVTFNVINVGGGTSVGRVGAGNSTSNEGAGAANFSVGAGQLVIYPASTITYVRFGPAGTGLNYFATFDNISVKELAGNHASQSTTTSRPILRNLYNLLTYTEQFDNAAWLKDAVTISTNTSATVAPDGTNTADKMVETSATADHYLSCLFTGGGTFTLTASIYAKAAERSWLTVSLYSGTVSLAASFNLAVGTVGTVGAGCTASIQDVGNGWYKCTFNRPSTSYASNARVAYGVNIADAGIAYAGDPTKGIYIWGASLVPANEASLPYQRVVTNTLGSGVYNSDVTKFPPYLYFDGTDDFLVTGNIDFSATDTMSVFAGVRKLISGTQIYIETGPNINTTNGTFQFVQADTSVGVAYGSRGSSVAAAFVPTSGFTAPITAVLTGLSTISTDYCILRINGAQVASTATDQGTGNYASAQPLYIGRRAGTTLPFNGRIYSLITRGALTTTPLLEKTEQWVATKTGVTL